MAIQTVSEDRAKDKDAATDPTRVRLTTGTVIIASYGRAGSTLMLGLLNQIDGYTIKGENELFTLGLFQAWQRLRKTAKQQGQRVAKNNIPSDPWYGACDIKMASFFANCRRLVKDVILTTEDERRNTRVYGFKEIRFHHAEDFSSYLSFLRVIMPNLRFIFLTREVEQIMKSKWWSDFDPAYVKKFVSTMDGKFLSYHAKYSDHTYTITYQDIVDRSETLVGLYNFLGEPFSFEDLDMTLSIRHSY